MYQCRLERFFSILCRRLAIIGSVGLTVMMAVVIVNILARRLFNSAIFGATEIVSYLSLFIGSIGLGRQEWTDGNIRMTILGDALPKRGKWLLEAIICVICTIGFAVVSYFIGKQAVVKAIAGNHTTNLHIPMCIPYGFMSVCFAFLTVCIAVKCGLFLTSFIKGTDNSQAPDNSGNV